MKILQNFVALSEYMNFNPIDFEVVTMHLFLQVNGFQGILQTSGFLAPGKKFGQLEVYNEENYLGPWDIASSSEVE